MIVGRLLAFCGLGMLVVMAMAYVAAHYPAPDTGHSPAGHMSGRTLAAPALSPATSAYRRLEYGPVPAFVRPVSMPDPDTAEAELHGGARLLLADFQHDATNPQAGLYMRQVTQAVTGIGVATVSRYQVSIDPRYQTLVIHEATVIRDGERQSREGRIAADFLRQEPELADGVMTGMELAVLRIEDIRQGDILDIAYSVTGENPLLAPHQTRVFPLAAVPDIEQLSVRTTWPRGTAHAVAGPAGADEITVERRGSRTSFVLEPRRTRALAVEEGAPPEHVQIPVLMVSSWPDWASVAQWGRSFYQLPEHTDPDTAALAAHIRESYGAPARQLVAALEYVQDEIRYQAILLGDSTYVPAPPGETLRIRTGDCKAKTLLLLALLDALGIEAYPVMASTETGRGLDAFLPSPQLFNHVFVQARLGGEVFWLEPAATAQRGGLFARVPPDYGFVLVLEPGANGLTNMSPQDIPVASTTYHEAFDLLRQSLDEPIEWSLEITHRGIAADQWRSIVRQLGLGQVEQIFTAFYADYRGSAELERPLTVEDDEEANVLILRASWRVAPLMSQPDVTGRREIRLRVHSLADMLATTDLERTSPVMTAYPVHRRHIIEGGIDLPGNNFWNLEDRAETISNAAFEFNFSVTYDNGLLSLVYDQQALSPSVMLDEQIVEDNRRMWQLARSYILWANTSTEDGRTEAVEKGS